MYVFDAICNAFNQKPEPCQKYVVRPTNLEKEGIPWYDIVLIILLIILLNVILYYFIRRAILKRLNKNEKIIAYIIQPNLNKKEENYLIDLNGEKIPQMKDGDLNSLII